MNNVRIHKARSHRRLIITTAIGLLVLIYCLFPIFWMIITSFKPSEEIFDLPIKYLPQRWTIEAYTDLFSRTSVAAQAIPFVLSLRNSLFVATVSVFIVVSLSSVAGYGFSRFRFKGSRFMLLSLVATRMLPGPAFMLPIYMMISRMGLLDSLWSLVLIHTVFGLPFGIWLATSYIDNVPLELEEAAIVDGCSRPGAFFRIVLPLSWIGLASVGIFHFLGSWSEFAFASILIESKELRTAPVSLAEFVLRFKSVDFNRIGAASVMMSAPLVALFFLIQKQFVRGFHAGAVKG